MANGSVLVPGIDGRSVRARIVRDLYQELTSDQGGEARLSRTRKELTLAMAISAALMREIAGEFVRGEPLDHETFTKHFNTIARGATMIGLDLKVIDLTPSVADLVAPKGKVAA